jgi:hypothetical protein
VLCRRPICQWRGLGQSPLVRQPYFAVAQALSNLARKSKSLWTSTTSFSLSIASH